jgi:ZIP family zinc transporter
MNAPWIDGVLGGLAAGAATGLGAIGVYAVRGLSARGHAVLLAIGGGIMLAATFFALLVPAVDAANTLVESNALSAAIVCGGIVLGIGGLWAANRFVPHEHFVKGREGPGADGDDFERIWLFVLAITLHNLPEGMAVGVGFASGDLHGGLSLAIGIGLQNIPEGLAVAAGLVAIGHSRTTAFLVSLGTGVLESLGAAFGAIAASLAASLLPWALAFAGGAMLFVIVAEVIPETRRSGDAEDLGVTFALLGGFLAMTALDILLR